MCHLQNNKTALLNISNCSKLYISNYTFQNYTFSRFCDTVVKQAVFIIEICLLLSYCSQEIYFQGTISSSVSKLNLFNNYYINSTLRLMERVFVKYYNNKFKVETAFLLLCSVSRDVPFYMIDNLKISLHGYFLSTVGLK